MADIPELVRRRMIDDTLRQKFEQTIEERIERCLEVSHQRVIPGHHFAEASAQCIDLYTDGYFLSTIMVTQAVAEGIQKLIRERNGISAPAPEKGPELVHLLIAKGIITSICGEAFNRIWGSYRNDLHHMNPGAAKVTYPVSSDLAKRNIQDLAVIEKEIFAVNLRNGALIPVQAKYWDIGPDGRAPIYLRCDR